MFIETIICFDPGIINFYPFIRVELQIEKNRALPKGNQKIAVVCLPMDFPVSAIFQSQPFEPRTNKEEDIQNAKLMALEEVSSLILTEFQRGDPEKFSEIFPPPRSESMSNFSEESDIIKSKSENRDDEADKNDTVDGKSWFRKQFPECLQGGPITPGKPLYLYQGCVLLFA